MNLYIWQDLDRMSDSYHTEGGLVVIAPTLHAARERLRATPGIPADSDAFAKEPSATYEIGVEHDECVIDFPNAGCC